MKRILSVLLTVVMVLSVMTLAPISSSALSAGHNLDSKNVGIDVPFFGGQVNFTELSGDVYEGDITGEDLGEITTNKPASAGVLNLDGVVTEAEWGKPIAEISRDYAATLNGREVSGENTYYWHCADGVERLDLSKDFSYSVWMAWDYEYLYIAAIVNDPDGQYVNDGGGDIWKGDCLQFILDPYGPNSIVHHDDPTAEYDPMVNPFPWYGAVRGGGSWKTSPYIANVGVGYLGSEWGGVEMYDMSRRYNPHRTAVYDYSGNLDYWSTDWDGYDVYYPNIRDAGIADNPIMGDDTYGYAAVKPIWANDPTNDRAYTTTYEIAVPWSLFSGTHFTFDDDTEQTTFNYVAPDPHVGAEYGMSLVVLNGATGAKNINSWLTWGAGVCGSQVEGDDVTTSGGSNSIVLSSENLKANQHEHTFAAPTCEAPYTCSCGYKKGFAVGHKYNSELINPLAANLAGALTMTCEYCGGVIDVNVPAVPQEVWAECSEAARPGPLSSSSEWYMGETDAEWTYVYKDDQGNMLFNPDNTMMTIYKAQGDQMIFDLTDGDAGTYFSTRNNRTSFSYKYDLRMTGEDLDLVYGDLQDHYSAGVYHWFGGKQISSGNYSYGMNYAAGFFPTVKGGTSGTFKIMEAKGGVIEGADQRVLAESEVFDLGTDWHEMVFVFDEANCAAFYYYDGECVVAAADPGMSMDGQGQVTLIRRFDTSCQFANLGLGSTTAFLDEVELTEFTVSCDGVVIGSYEAGATVDLPVPALTENMGAFRRFYTWQGEDVVRSGFISKTTSNNGRTYTLVMPAHNVELTSQFVLLGDLDGNGKINGQDLKIFKKMVAGSMEGTELQREAADLKLDGKVNGQDMSPLKKVINGAASGVITQ